MMRTIAIAATVMMFSGAALAEPKGKPVADAVSVGGGAAKVASTLIGGWGNLESPRVASGNAITAAPKPD